MDLDRTQNLTAQGTTGCPVVSFCIATFQRYEILEELIREILSVRTDKIEVVVCDDKSLDGSIEKVKKIEDARLKIYVNEENVGSSLNIHDSLDKGSGKYLFYVNDRDNVDLFKIEKLVEILEELEKKDVAFAKCSAVKGGMEKYHIYREGEEALLQFACRMDHPTGYIFRRCSWKKIKNRRVLFENQAYGDYPITQICAILAKRYKGARIYGDICDVNRLRIDFSEIKSGYYLKRKDKRLWYTPEVVSRELMISRNFLKAIGVQENIRNRILADRYKEWLAICVTGYEACIANPSNTAHYDVYPCQDFLHVFAVSILNGIKLYGGMNYLCFTDNNKLIPEINKITRREFVNYFQKVLRDDFHLIKGKKTRECEKKDYEICKREAVLNTYEKWLDAVICRKMVSEYLFQNGYHHVAIYGMGRIGKHLWKEFQSSNIYVDYIIDREISKRAGYYEDVPCFDLESELPSADMIIVTIPSEGEKIASELRKKAGWPVKQIEEILFVLD